MQKKLEEFFEPRPSTPEIICQIGHRELIIYFLQLGMAFTEKSLLRALRQEIVVLRAKGRCIAPVTPQKLRQHLQQLAREKIVEQIGYCWQLRR